MWDMGLSTLVSKKCGVWSLKWGGGVMKFQHFMIGHLVLLLVSGSAMAASDAQKPTAAELFTTARSPGSVAVGAAEGNLTPAGEMRSIYYGHIDPGNHVTNRGFCSWNRAANLTVVEADRRCLAALQQQSIATEQRLTAQGVDPATHAAALVNGTDLWNQSNQAGAQFAAKYKQALGGGLKNSAALIDARVEAFRNSGGQLDASGLFGICARQPYYQNRLASLTRYSETWRWQCIALDQGRRVREVASALQQQLGMTEGTGEMENRGEVEVVRTSSPQAVTSVALNFEPTQHSVILVQPKSKSPQLTSPTSESSVTLSFEPESQPGQYLASAKS